jgi:hypothetical protein
MYCFDVAHSANFAASCDFEVLGIANDHDHSQWEPFGVTATGAAARPTLSATCDWALLERLQRKPDAETIKANFRFPVQGFPDGTATLDERAGRNFFRYRALCVEAHAAHRAHRSTDTMPLMQRGCARVRSISLNTYFGSGTCNSE